MKNIRLEQAKVDELVDRFYQNLTKDSYYRSMFAERNVDMDKLKERQKVFISRLINEDDSEQDEKNVEQVQERHPFQTTPERANIWLNIMEKTMDDMQMASEVKDLLLQKMRSLMSHLIKK